MKSPFVIEYTDYFGFVNSVVVYGDDAVEALRKFEASHEYDCKINNIYRDTKTMLAVRGY